MTELVQSFLDYFRTRSYRKVRTTLPPMTFTEVERDRDRYFEAVLARITEAETPVLRHTGDIFGFNRTIAMRFEWDAYMNNHTPDYAWAIERGFDAILADFAQKALSADEEGRAFYTAASKSIMIVLDFCERYRLAAEQTGCAKLAKALENVPRKAARNYYEALVFMKILIFSQRASGVQHLTLGRFDQYMYPYYLASLEAGVSADDLLEETELFFISINLDTDVYFGMQQGDNGQSLMLGGCTAEQEDAFNALSETVLTASEELCLIDPKINLRVSAKTPLERYVRATRLTAKGLGFPQYCNDDVVIPGLVRLGYDYKDACQYTVAACWEFIIPARGYDVPNIRTLNFPLAVREATMESLADAETFEDFFAAVEQKIFAHFQAKRRAVTSRKDDLHRMPKNPYGSIFLTDCREKGRDYTACVTKYNNYGIHGLGVGPAVDALTAICRAVYEEKSVGKDELLAALENDFRDAEPLRRRLLACPKLGSGDEVPERLMVRMLQFYAGAVNLTPNGIGGIWRAGTGGSLDYVTMSRDVGATADGRHAGEPFPSSFSPSIGVRAAGLLSVIEAFTRPDMKNLINGGPLTIELHTNVFRNEEGVRKVAILVSEFIRRGGHELQLNALHRDTLIEAQKHPENYPDLIVRVWGWSGYFCELDLPFQNQIISRTDYQV
ncbi:MAG: pyruvate formate-lyase [Clostridia bacterium]|nr:pyruvate formate-lyase [Clostridia bacterium]